MQTYPRFGIKPFFIFILKAKDWGDADISNILSRSRYSLIGIITPLSQRSIPVPAYLCTIRFEPGIVPVPLSSATHKL